MKDLTFAIATAADIGVAVVRWSNSYSRMYRWNLKDDTFEPGQFLKAGATVLGISPEGKYVVYYAEKHGIAAEAYIAVSHPPYFTAMACFQDFFRYAHYAEFISSSKLELGTFGSWPDAFPESGHRIDPGCPLTIQIVPRKELSSPPMWVEDKKRNRKVWACRNGICASPLDADKPRCLVSFHREEFKPIAPPGWASHW